MGEYKELYYKLFNKITDVIVELQELQTEAEEIYISKPEMQKNIKIEFKK